MRVLPILYPNQKPFREFFQATYIGISLETMPHGEIFSVILWRDDGIGIRISNEMTDIAERTEIGRLKFSITEEKIYENLKIKFSITKDSYIKLYSIIESNFIAESGISFELNKEEIIIIANSFPGMLAVKFKELSKQSFSPEYPLGNYITKFI